MSNQKKTLKDATKDLELVYEEQDWGIINSDPLRVKEFIIYFNKNLKQGDNSFKYYMFELIVSSFNDAILENKIKDLENIFSDFINKYKNEKLYQTIFSYWIEIKSNYDFPVGNYLIIYKP